jgi:superfamily II DNA/RNA helicase
MYAVPLKFYSAYPGTKLKLEFMKIEQGIDLMVTTPDRLQRHRDAKKIFLSNCETLIIDEWDTLIDSGYSSFVENLVQNMKKKEEGQNRQVVLWAATFTKHMETLMIKNLGTEGIEKIIEENTHMNLANLDHEFIKLGEKDKYGPLELILKEFKDFRKHANTSAIVFCNSISSWRSAMHTISSLGFKVSSLHGDIPPNLRNSYYEEFKNQKTEILVATDLASRGLDFPFVSHIYNLDFPRTVSDYMHRAGRAGRAGRVGYVKSFYRNYDMAIIEEMRRSHEEAIPLDIGSSAFTLRKTNEKFVGAQKVPVSDPEKRKNIGDPLASKAEMIIKKYSVEGKEKTEEKKEKERVLRFRKKSQSASKRDKRNPIQERSEKRKIERKAETFTKKKNKFFMPN